MTTYNCPKGHTSTEADFCSICGTRIEGSSTPATPSPSTSSTIPCPDCGTIHDPHDGKFCEICGYNFDTGKSGELPIDPTPVPIPPLYIPDLPGIDLPPPPPPATQTLWTVTIAIDPSLAAPESPTPPTQAPQEHRISPGMAHLLGRTNISRAITPEIALDFDNAISSRHAILACQSDGQLILRDIGSSNGTQLNGVDLEAMKDYPLKLGDRITLGHWTSLTLR